MPERPSVLLAWELSFPMGDFEQYVGEPSYRGWSLTAEWPVVAGLRLGGAFHHAFFNETKARQTYELEAGAITGTLYNYVDIYTLGAVARYRFLDPTEEIRPVVGVELGAAFVSAHTFIADLGLHDTPGGFLMAAEVGSVATFGRTMLASLVLRYRFTTADIGGARNPGYLSLQLGLGWEPH